MSPVQSVCSKRCSDDVRPCADRNVARPGRSRTVLTPGARHNDRYCYRTIDALERRDADEIVERIDDRSARGIAAAIGRLITAGDLAVGTRLPTVRELSKSLGVVADHGQRGVADADVGRRDRRPRPQRHVRAPTDRARRPAALPRGSPRARATSRSTCRPARPTPALLPDLGPVVARVSRQSLTSSYLDHPVLPALDEDLRDGVAVPARGAHRRRRRDGRPRPRRPGRRAPRRPGGRRAPDVPAAARPARRSSAPR